MYKLTENGVIRLSDNAFIPADLGNRDYTDYLSWVDEGNTPLPIPKPSRESVVKGYVDAIQLYMDKEAQQHGYDSVHTAVSYAEESSVLKFQDEGKAFRAWRSLCWAYCYNLLDKYQEIEDAPTIQEIIGNLPLLEIKYTENNL